MAEEASEVMLPTLLVWTRGGAGTPTAAARPRAMRRSLAIVELLAAGVRRDGQVVIVGGDPAPCGDLLNTPYLDRVSARGAALATGGTNTWHRWWPGRTSLSLSFVVMYPCLRSD